MEHLLLILNKKDSASLGKVRCIPSLEIFEAKNALWLRGLSSTDTLASSLLKLPFVGILKYDNSGNIFELKSKIPKGKLPNEGWIALKSYLPVEAPVASIAGLKVVEKNVLKLVKTSIQKEAAAIICQIVDLDIFNQNASRHRLEKLVFATNQIGRTILIGQPIPLIPGETYYLSDGLFIPSGWALEFPFLAKWISQKHNPQGDAMLFASQNGKLEKIPKSDFKLANRSAIRLTAKSML